MLINFLIFFAMMTNKVKAIYNSIWLEKDHKAERKCKRLAAILQENYQNLKTFSTIRLFASTIRLESFSS